MTASCDQRSSPMEVQNHPRPKKLIGRAFRLRFVTDGEIRLLIDGRTTGNLASGRRFEGLNTFIVRQSSESKGTGRPYQEY